jgi:hypothetical protein
MESKFDDNLIMSASIKDYGETYELGCLIDKNGKYEIPWLSFKDKKVDCWDGSEWIYNTLLPILRKFRANELFSPLEREEFRETLEVIPEEDLEIVLEMLEKGESLGFFDEFKQH